MCVFCILEGCQLPASADVEETTGGVSAGGGEGVAVRKKGNAVHVRLVTGEGLCALAAAEVAELHGAVRGAGGDSGAVRVERHAQAVGCVVRQLGSGAAGADVPQAG